MALAMLTNVKHCPDCGESDLAAFAPDRSRKDGLSHYCRPCRNARQRQWNKTPAGIACRKDLYWHFPAMAKARVYVHRAVKCGLLVRPDRCADCGTVGRVEGHHFLGYAKEHWLDVRWLCRSCHRLADEKMLAGET